MNKTKMSMSASNTKECFRECVGKKVKGVLFNALPFGSRELAHGTKTLIFDDGSGITFSNNGTYWRELPEEVTRAIKNAKKELEDAVVDLEDVLFMAGEENV
jgi:hypothetical protein